MGTLRRTWSRRWLARRMTWKGSATPGAWGSTRLYAFRYEPDMTRHRPADSLTPFGGLRPEPGCGAFCRSTTDYVEPAGGLPRRRQRCTRPWFATCLSARTTLLVDAHSPDLAYPVGVGFQQGFAPAADLVVHRMPPTTKFCGDLVDRAAPPADPGPTPMVTHRAARDVNNARWGPIVGPCSMNDLSAQSGFGHVQRRFRHRSRTGRPNAGKSTNTTVRSPLDHTGPPQASQDGRALRDPITTSKGAPSPESLIPTRSTSPRPTNFSHMRAGISFHRGPPASDVAYQQPIMEDPPLTSGGFRSPLTDPLLPTHSRRATLRGYPHRGERRMVQGLR